MKRLSFLLLLMATALGGFAQSGLTRTHIHTSLPAGNNIFGHHLSPVKGGLALAISADDGMGARTAHIQGRSLSGDSLWTVTLPGAVYVDFLGMRSDSAAVVMGTNDAFRSAFQLLVVKPSGVLFQTLISGYHQMGDPPAVIGHGDTLWLTQLHDSMPVVTAVSVQTGATLFHKTLSWVNVGDTDNHRVAIAAQQNGGVALFWSIRENNGLQSRQFGALLDANGDTLLTRMLGTTPLRYATNPPYTQAIALASGNWALTTQFNYQDTIYVRKLTAGLGLVALSKVVPVPIGSGTSNAPQRLLAASGNALLFRMVNVAVGAVDAGTGQQSTWTFRTEAGQGAQAIMVATSICAASGRYYVLANGPSNAIDLFSFLPTMPSGVRDDAPALNAQVSLYPNPATDEANIRFDYDAQGTATLQTPDGTIINTFPLMGRLTIVSLASLPSGIYILTLETKTNKQTLKICKL